jgi:hypothetical protein
MKKTLAFVQYIAHSRAMQSRLTPFSKTAVPAPRLDESRVVGCEYLHYPWDDWEQWAIAQGLDADLAALARLTIREAFNHGWSDRLKSLCGWRDDGRRMLRLALRSPKTAEKRWNRLLETDGLRGEYDEKTGQWVSWT